MFNNETMPRIALGTWSWGAGKNGSDAIFGTIHETARLEEVFNKAMDAGLTLWDTAFVYGMGSSEKNLAEFIARSGKDVILSTKFTPRPKLEDNALADTLNGSLERLNRESVEFYWIHNPQDVERWCNLVAEEVKAGKVKYVGVSNHNLEEVKRAAETLAQHGIKLAAVQNHYSLLYRGSEECGLLDWCKENDVAFFAYMVLEQGALTGAFSSKNPFPENSLRSKHISAEELDALQPLMDVMAEIGAKHNGATNSQVAIAWALAKGTLPIVGATKLHHVDSVVGALDVELSAEEIELLEKTAAATGIRKVGVWEKEMHA